MTSVSLLQAAISKANDAFVICDCSQSSPLIEFVSESFEKLTGFSAEQVLSKNFFSIFVTESDDAQRAQFEQMIMERNEETFRLNSFTQSGVSFACEIKTYQINEDQNKAQLLLVIKDVSQEEYAVNVLNKVNLLYREMSKRLEFTNETDNLTKLKNRCHLTTRGEFMLSAAKREKLRLHSMLVSIDNFNLITVAGGSDFSEICLVKVAKVIQQYFNRATDIAVRFNDDQFAIVCIEDDDARVHERAELLRQGVRRIDLTAYENEYDSLSVSIGVFSIIPDKYTTLDQMIENASQMLIPDISDAVAQSANRGTG